MKATDELKSEHRVIERVLASLETMARRLEAGESVRPQFFTDAADFIKGFADGCHHHKEEGVLFPALMGAGMPKEQGPIAVMLSEHEQGRTLARNMRAAAERLAEGEPSTAAAVAENARGYAALLRQHIFKEDNVLFNLAEQVLGPAVRTQVEEGFAHVEHAETGHGVHAKYLALAEALERESRV